MTGHVQKRDDLDALLLEHGGLKGLARELGQHDPASVLYEDANDNEPPKRARLWRRLLGRLRY
jgi:hypothetical protein